uniref:LIM zinc-binding domain-containing protein n=1 Tax=Syphacia muris TaxID=451379 RepID=A0A0N5ANU4_9BILA
MPTLQEHLKIEIVNNRRFQALQAFGKTYHPQCFRCFSCNKCLDGIPFAVDDQQRIYCTKDYGELFAPKCVQCQKPIYQADGCRCKLTEVGDSACYPLNGHILCQNCHRIWKRTGGTESIITDL